MGNIIDRIRVVLDEKSNGNQNKMANEIGVKQNTLNGYLNGKNQKLPFHVVEKIVYAYKDVSPEWLITGEGSMYRNDSSNMEVMRIGNSKVVGGIKEEQVINLYDMESAANLKTMFDNRTANIIGSLVLPNMPKVDGAMFVRGDSMYPILKSGDIIVYKEIEPQYITFGEMYVVNYVLGEDDYVVVKFVKRSEIAGCVQLVSYNTHHEPMDIRIDTIRAIALVKCSVRYNTIM